MAPGAVVVAAAAARALDNLLFAFRAADATAPSRAQSLAQIGVGPSAQLAALERAGVIKHGADSASRWLDERALRGYKAQSQSRALLVAAMAGLAMLVAAAMAFLVTRR